MNDHEVVNDATSARDLQVTDQQTNDRRPTILQVAQLAGVSHQTVSRYLRFEGKGLKAPTRERVEAAINELNYRPNLVARSMRTRTTGRVAVLMPPLAFNPARMLAGATQAAHDAGYTVEVIAQEGGAEARGVRMLELADSRQVDGILSLAPVSLREDQFPADPVAVVSADFDDEMRGIGELADAKPVEEMIERLAELGHRRFYHVAGADNFMSARARAQMFLDTVDRLGLVSVGVYPGDWSGQSGIDAVHAIRSGDEPTAIIAANDLVATGVMRGAVERGWDIPGTVSLTGWDNQLVDDFLTPSLTSVDVNLENVGRKAMTRLIARLRNTEPDLSTESINRVVWRESTGPAPQ